MPKGYELESYYDALRAVHRKIYSREIKKLAGKIKDFGYLNDNLYGLVISSLNDGLADNLGYLTYDTHQISKADIGLNSNSRAQDFMSPLELRINSLAVRQAIVAINYLSHRASVKDIKSVCYNAGQSTGLEFQCLKLGGKRAEFVLGIKSPVLSTTPIIKKFDKQLTLGTYPKGEPVVYTDIRKTEREDLIVANKNALVELKKQMIRLGLPDKSSCKNALKMLNVGYYFVEDIKTTTLEMSTLLFEDFDTNKIYHAELAMNLEKLTMAVNKLKQMSHASADMINSAMYTTGVKARNQVIEEYKMLPEMFSGFYNVYAEGEKIYAINKEKLEQSRKVKLDQDTKIK